MNNLRYIKYKPIYEELDKPGEIWDFDDELTQDPYKFYLGMRASYTFHANNGRYPEPKDADALYQIIEDLVK